MRAAPAATRAVLLQAVVLVGLSCAPRLAPAQSDPRETVTPTDPAGWAMGYVTSATVMTGFGGSPRLDPGQWALGAELGFIPSLSASQRRVGFGGIKEEDLNKSPAFGRIRGWLGLPAGVVFELGYTPELTIADVRPRHLWALALGRELFASGAFSVGARVLAQRGRARSDITCPAGVAGDPDPGVNPFGCAARSRDEVRMNYQGAELTAGWQPVPQGPRVFLGFGHLRVIPEVRVDAPLVFGVRDRTRLRTESHVNYLEAGVVQRLDERFELAGEFLYVPLRVDRPPIGGSERDAYWSLRVLLRWRPAVLQ